MKRLVMNRYVPGPAPTGAFLDAAGRSAARIGYKGEIIAPTDLQVITL